MVGFVGSGRLVPGRSEVLRRPRCCSLSRAVERGNGDGSSGKRTPLDLTELTKRLGELLGMESNGTFAETLKPLKEEVDGVAATIQVAVVFGKALVRDQLTVEYAKRILALVKQITAGEKRISVVRPSQHCNSEGKQTSVPQDSRPSSSTVMSMFYSLFWEAGKRNVCFIFWFPFRLTWVWGGRFALWVDGNMEV